MTAKYLIYYVFERMFVLFAISILAFLNRSDNSVVIHNFRLHPSMGSAMLLYTAWSPIQRIADRALKTLNNFQTIERGDDSDRRQLRSFS